MSISDRDYEVLLKIIHYCEEIELTHERFFHSQETFLGDFIYRNAIAMCILQIGELTAHLSDSFRESYKQAPWQAIKSMRNFVAHQYGKVDSEMLWETSNKRILELKAYCESIRMEQDLAHRPLV